MSLRLRMTLLSGLAVFAVVALFGVGVYLVMSVTLYNQTDKGLQGASDRIVRHIDRAPPSRFVTSAGLRQLLVGTDEQYMVALYNAQGDQLISSQNFDGKIVISDQVRNRALSGPPQSITLRGTQLRVLVTGVTSTTPLPPDAPRLIVVVEDISSLQTTLRVLELILAGGAATVLIVAVGLGWIVAGRSLAPVTSLTRAAERLGGGGELGRRLPSPHTRDEIYRLSAAFNGSLDRLEGVYRELAESLARQQRFVADASHELRTPLTVILSNAENLRDQPQLPVTERTEWLDEVIEEAKRMATLSSDLLLLARADTDEQLRLGEVVWRELLDQVVRDAHRLCDPRPITVTAPADLGRGIADRMAMLRVFRVLFENIARHTPETAAVELVAWREGAWLRFTVADAGPGVPAAQLPHIFDRFFQADQSRRGRGTGLGLAIARNIVLHHRGQIAARNRPPRGLEIAVRIPVTLEAPNELEAAAR
ncbi:MAG: HAMP domain-containing sensor histidine kinase [Candidatus Dormiibacterota bacterium]